MTRSHQDDYILRCRDCSQSDLCGAPRSRMFVWPLKLNSKCSGQFFLVFVAEQKPHQICDHATTTTNYNCNNNEMSRHVSYGSGEEAPFHPNMNQPRDCTSCHSAGTRKICTLVGSPTPGVSWTTRACQAGKEQREFNQSSAQKSRSPDTIPSLEFPAHDAVYESAGLANVSVLRHCSGFSFRAPEDEDEEREVSQAVAPCYCLQALVQEPASRSVDLKKRLMTKTFSSPNERGGFSATCLIGVHDAHAFRRRSHWRPPETSWPPSPPLTL